MTLTMAAQGFHAGRAIASAGRLPRPSFQPPCPASPLVIAETVDRVMPEEFSQDAAKRLRAAGPRLEGLVRVTTVDALATHIRTAGLKPLQDAHLCIVIELIIDNRSLSLARREADIAVRLGRFDAHGMVGRKIGEMAFAVYTSPVYLEAHGRPDSGSGAPGQTTVRVQDDLLDTPDGRWFADCTTQAEPALLASSRENQLQGMMAGHGFGQLPCYLPARPSNLLRLDTGKASTREIWMGVHPHTRHVPRITAVQDVLVAAIALNKAVLLPEFDTVAPSPSPVSQPQKECIMTAKPTIGILIGSLQANGLSRKLAAAIQTLGADQFHVSVIEIGALPLYNPEREGQGVAEWNDFRAAVAPMDGILFVTPEYNRSVPGALKNAIDVGSRPYGASVWAGKPAGVVSQSPGAIGGFGANHHLRQSLVFLDMPAMQQPEAYLGHAASLFDDAGTLVEGSGKTFLEGFVTTFTAWVALHPAKTV